MDFSVPVHMPSRAAWLSLVVDMVSVGVGLSGVLGFAVGFEFGFGFGFGFGSRFGFPVRFASVAFWCASALSASSRCRAKSVNFWYCCSATMAFVSSD